MDQNTQKYKVVQKYISSSAQYFAVSEFILKPKKIVHYNQQRNMCSEKLEKIKR